MNAVARVAIVGATALLACLATRAARAQAPDVAGDLTLTWTAPAGCPVGEDVRAAALRGVDRSRMLPGTLAADGAVEQLGTTTWRVRLRTRRGDTTGERVIEGPTCAGVADATAVVLALALVPPTTIAPPEEPPPPVAPSPTPAPRSELAKPASSHNVAVGVAVAGVVGALPKLGGGAAIDLAWTPGRWRIEAEGRLLGSQTAQLSGSVASAELSWKEIGARGCFAVLATTSFDLAPCLGMTWEFVSADGRGTGADRSGSTVWASFAGGLLGRAFLANWLAIRARVDGVVPFTRPLFVVRDATTGDSTVFRPPTLGVAGYFGAEVLFL